MLWKRETAIQDSIFKRLKIKSLVSQKQNHIYNFICTYRMCLCHYALCSGMAVYKLVHVLCTVKKIKLNAVCKDFIGLEIFSMYLRLFASHSKVYSQRISNDCERFQVNSFLKRFELYGWTTNICCFLQYLWQLFHLVCTHLQQKCNHVNSHGHVFFGEYTSKRTDSQHLWSV